VEETFGHKCFEMLLLMSTQGVSLITNFSVSHRIVILLFVRVEFNGMLVRVFSAAAPVMDSPHLGAALKLAFLQTNLSLATKAREHGGVAPRAYR